MIRTVPLPVDHHVLGPHVLMQHPEAMERAQAVGDLLDDAAHRLDVRPRMIGHPLRERPAVDELGDDVQEAARRRRLAGAHDVRVVDASRDPLLHQETLELRGRLAIDRRRLQHDRFAARGVDREPDVAAMAAVQLADDLEAVDALPRRELGRRRQRRQRLVQLVRVARRQCVDDDDLHREVVGRAATQRLVDDRAGGGIEVVAMRRDRRRRSRPRRRTRGRRRSRARTRRRPRSRASVVDLDAWRDAERAREQAVLRRRRRRDARRSAARAVRRRGARCARRRHGTGAPSSTRSTSALNVQT